MVYQSTLTPYRKNVLLDFCFVLLIFITWKISSNDGNNTIRKTTLGRKDILGFLLGIDGTFYKLSWAGWGSQLGQRMAKAGPGLRRAGEAWSDPELGLRLWLEVGKGRGQGWEFQAGPNCPLNATSCLGSRRFHLPWSFSIIEWTGQDYWFLFPGTLHFFLFYYFFNDFLLC